MKEKSAAEVLAETARHSTGNRHELEASKYAGCYACCAAFDASEVTSWRDEWDTSEKQNKVRRWTATCPRCGSATVIGSASGLLEDQGYLPIVNYMLAQQRGEKR